MNIKKLSLLFVSLLLAACSQQKKLITEIVPIKVLYLTGGGYHDYKSQAKMINQFILNRINAVVDIKWDEESFKKNCCGSKEYGTEKDKHSFANPNLAKNHDVVIINFCQAESNNEKVLDNLTNIAQNGKPFIVIHCTLHSYRDNKKLNKKWVKFLGVSSKRHESKNSFPIIKVSNNPIVKNLPKTWIPKEGELYKIISTQPNIEKLTQSYSKKSKSHHVSTWINPYGKSKIYGTSLGHYNSFFKAKYFQTLISNMVLASVDKLSKNGKPKNGYKGPNKVLDFSNF